MEQVMQQYYRSEVARIEAAIEDALESMRNGYDVCPHRCIRLEEELQNVKNKL